MNQETFQIFLWVMSAVALAVFIALYFVKAGYGMFRTASWGISINNKFTFSNSSHFTLKPTHPNNPFENLLYSLSESSASTYFLFISL